MIIQSPVEVVVVVGAPVLDLDDIVVLHFQYTAWERMRSKQRWYQTWELLREDGDGPLEIFRRYHHMHGGWPPEEIQPVKPSWMAGFVESGADFDRLQAEPLPRQVRPLDARPLDARPLETRPRETRPLERRPAPTPYREPLDVEAEDLASNDLEDPW